MADLSQEIKMFKNITSALIACGLVTPVWAATDAIFDNPFY